MSASNDQASRTALQPRYLAFTLSAALILSIPTDHALVWETATAIAVVLSVIGIWRQGAAILFGLLLAASMLLMRKVGQPSTGQATIDTALSALMESGLLRGIILALCVRMLWDMSTPVRNRIGEWVRS